MTLDSIDVRIRPAERGDAAALSGLIRELAEYEKLSGAVRDDPVRLENELFDHRAAEALIAEIDSEPVGYAVFFTTFSTFESRRGIWIEDLYVQPAQRRRGIGGAMLSRLAAIAVTRDFARLEWSALEWNKPALSFYEKLGATPMAEWRTLRLDGGPLRRLGDASGA